MFIVLNNNEDKSCGTPACFMADIPQFYVFCVSTISVSIIFAEQNRLDSPTHRTVLLRRRLPPADPGSVSFFPPLILILDIPFPLPF
jgi:hypothetical protein